MINRPRLLSRRPRGATRGSGAAAGPERGRAPSGGGWDPAGTGASPRMDGDPPAGQGPTARAAEQEGGGGGGAAGALPIPGTRSDPPAARGDRDRPVLVSAITNSAFEGAPPPYSPPDPKNVHVLYPPFPAGFSQQQPVFYQPGPGPRSFPAAGFPPGPLPYNIYNAQPGAGPFPASHGQQLPKDYMVESVLVTLFCCLLTGVMALIYSHETRAALARGDVAQAHVASRKAQSLVLFSLLFGLFASISWIIYVLVSLYV
ncbi:LOW QUALITY PROTEIN: proline rich transmembrane protein 1B [Malurus melanocephalus]|uniref:LOW QUALITY PROTEIN: proline rich transmembrane protein 1B n=1 Tax=Malurus melanocephalus TaxID=175006 RepID=UPI0025478885|nr:LOW QUALITY PROTEIN: proline rich transmembrane protein 1B [Malurus melanocephalus]